MEQRPELHREDNVVEEFKGVRVPLPPTPEFEITPPDIERLPDYEMYVLPGMRAQIEAAVAETANCTLPVKTPPKSAGTGALFAVPAQQILRTEGQAAVDTVAEAVRTELGVMATVDTSGPFINIAPEKDLLADTVIEEIAVLGEAYGENASGQGETVVLDVSSPNIAKSMHLGHLRSTVIGEALSRILKANGYNTLRDNHLGDWGTQFGILAQAHSMWADEIPELEDEATQVAGLQKLYVRINQAIADEKAASDDDHSQLEDAGREWFARLEQGDPQARSVWQWASDISMREFNEVYEKLGVQFEYILGESVYADMNEEVYRELAEKGIAREDERGRLQLVPRSDKIPELTVRKSDGSSMYATRDIAALCARMAWFNPSKIVYVVGREQEDHFRGVFDGFEQLAGDDVPEMKHVSFGAITLPEGKMSTRKGNVVFLNDVLEQAYERAAQRVGENLASQGKPFTEEERDQIAWQVAVGALIYYDLKQPGGRNITFEWDEVLNFHGNTGPYLQYAHARIAAMLEKAEEQDTPMAFDADVLDLDGPEGELVTLLGEYPMAVEKSGRDYDPSEVSEYLYKLAHAFNGYYKDTPILREPDMWVRATRLTLVKSVQQVLRNGLTLLNIPIPQKM